MRRSIAGPISGLVHWSTPTTEHATVTTQSATDASPPPPRHASTVSGSMLRGDPDQKPVVQGSGVKATIRLTEPMLFLQGNETSTQHNFSTSTAMLRGSLHLHVTKGVKLKAITLKFRGRAVTKWPEGIPPRKVDLQEVQNIMSHTWPFFSAQFPAAEHGTGADHFAPIKSSDSLVNASSANVAAKEARRLSLQVNQSRSFANDDLPAAYGPTVASKGYRTFQPGDYFYNFELPIDSRMPESIEADLGSVRYELEATIERAGAFKTNLVGTHEVTLIRVPAEGSLEQVEPIAISRDWDDQLHYEIVISGKSFPLGAQVPIAFKLTPLAKVQCHKIRVLLTENTEYFCNNKRVHRMEPVRKVQLMEKRADSMLASAFPGSTMSVTAGGGIPYDARAMAASGVQVTTADPGNLLGNLQGEVNVGPTEMEFSVQLPNCSQLRDRDGTWKLHPDTTYQNIQIHHWIKIVLRLSKPDVVDPSKRRHFEISIDSPFQILSCRATQANTMLPAYTTPDTSRQDTSLYECGCPNAARRRNSLVSVSPILDCMRRSSQTEHDAQPGSAEPRRPPTAHMHANNGGARPIHMIRAPSFNPPAFEAEEPPPPLITPPPQYDSIASPTSGLADYFSRLSDAYDDDDDEDSGGNSRERVEVPLTPGARVNRSMDITRTWVPIGEY